MNRAIRKQLLEIIKEAGQLYDLVQKTLEGGALGKKVTYAERIRLSNGLIADIPTNPFGPSGAVNIMFMFRYYRSTPPWKTAGINQVVVHGDVKGQGPKSITSGISQVIGHLKKKNPQAHLGKYAISAFSGGGSVVGKITKDLNSVEASVGKPVDAIFMADAGHSRLTENSGMVQYAKKAADPKSNRKLVFLHSAIPGPKYKGQTFPSTTEYSNNLMQYLGMQRQKNNIATDDPRYAALNVKPKSITSNNGVHIIQVDDDSKRKWMPGRDKFTPGTSGYMHRQIVDEQLPNAWNQYLQGWS